MAEISMSTNPITDKPIAANTTPFARFVPTTANAKLIRKSKPAKKAETAAMLLCVETKEKLQLALF